MKEENNREEEVAELPGKEICGGTGEQEREDKPQENAKKAGIKHKCAERRGE